MQRIERDSMPFDIFIAHAGADLAKAQELRGHLIGLDRRVKVFVDENGLTPGDCWPSVLQEVQSQALMTVAVLSNNSKNSHYLQEEVLRAVDLGRKDRAKHVLVPVLLEGKFQDLLPGTLTLHSLDATRKGGLARVAADLLQKLAPLKQVHVHNYGGLLKLAGFEVPYIPIRGANAAPLKMEAVSCNFDFKEHSLAPEFAAASRSIDVSGVTNIPSCGLSSYDVSTADHLVVRFFRTYYLDYLRSSELLDSPVPGGHGKSFRTEFADLVGGDVRSLMSMKLPNICGTGLTVLSRDDHVLVTRHSQRSHVYPGRWTFSSSGTLKWGAAPHPFTEALVKSRSEINHQLDLASTTLVGFGADARKLYFQFSLLEKSNVSSNQLTKQIEQGIALKLIKPLEWRFIALHSVATVLDGLMEGCWEPSAEATLLGLSIQRFGHEAVAEGIHARRQAWHRRRVLDEWDYRAGAVGLLAVMSVRYPRTKLHNLSNEFTQEVLNFMDRDIYRRRILEVGCGIGRLTKPLSLKATHITAIDLCERMLKRAEEAIAKNHPKVTFVHDFAQNYRTRKRFDVAISCLMLVHNVDPEEFHAVVDVMCRSARTVFVFEDVTQERNTSAHTRLRTKEEIKKAFETQGFRLAREESSKLSHDTIAFLKFVEEERVKTGE